MGLRTLTVTPNGKANRRRMRPVEREVRPRTETKGEGHGRTEREILDGLALHERLYQAALDREATGPIPTIPRP
jgi:hypothetical protein